MAFLGEETQTDPFTVLTDVFKETQRKMDVMSDVATTRDQVFEQNQDKPLKIFIGLGVGMWAIYHFLIKR